MRKNWLKYMNSGKNVFFTDAYVLKDRIYPGAREFLTSLNNRGYKLVYLTGRHKEGMSEGTVKSFNRVGLPPGSFFFQTFF